MGPWETSAPSIRIVRRPEGEAPEWVRDAWIGLELPLVVDDVVTTRGFGVLSGPKSRLSEWLATLMGRVDLYSGYIVDAHRAVTILERTQPNAARWWRDQAPDVVAPGCQFIFDAPACERSD